MSTRELAREWERLELLSVALARSRAGTAPDAALLERLRGVQAAVDAGRAQGSGWARIGAELSDLELDVLACTLAPEAEPRLGHQFAALQPAGTELFPSTALIQELLALGAADAGPLHAALAPGAALRRHRLVEADGDGLYAPLRPSRDAVIRLLERPGEASSPPGSVPVPTRPGWHELVLPPDRMAALREFLGWIRHRDTVFERWGARPVGGPVALFAGASGTGKTLAAAVLATDLGWPLFRVDIGRLVSKYIGETEKNLNRLFDAAHGRPIVLQFDEADSLFGRRGEVREARDRYANLEVSHLLARIEAHEGPCVLTTNLRRHLDPAFVRRFQVVVDFPRPAPEARVRLWHTLLPPRAPLADDVDVDAIGAAIALTGGGIRNAALHAAVLAAASDTPIGRGHVALAVWRELAKDGRELVPTALGPFAGDLPRNLAGLPEPELEPDEELAA
jgi:hypothetical protein